MHLDINCPPIFYMRSTTMTELFRTLYNSAVLSFHPLARFASVCRSLGLVVLTGCHIYHLSLINHGPLIICSFHIFYPFIVHCYIATTMLPTHLLHGDFFLKGEAGRRQEIVEKNPEKLYETPCTQSYPLHDNG